MLTFLSLAQNLPFAAALALMLGLLGLQLLGAGDLGHDTDAGADSDGGALAWLGLGRVPLLALLIILLTVFGLVGLKAQAILQVVTGAPASAWLVAPPAFLLSLPVTRVLARALSRLLPSIETTALPREALVGRRGVVAIGLAAAGSPAQARVRDHLGQTHHVMVEPEATSASLPEGAEILITRQEGAQFRAIAVEPNPFLTATQGAR